jgi:hypothetical protein
MVIKIVHFSARTANKSTSLSAGRDRPSFFILITTRLMILFAKAMHSHVSSVDGRMGNNVEYQIKTAVDDSRASTTIKINCKFAEIKIFKGNSLVLWRTSSYLLGFFAVFL